MFILSFMSLALGDITVKTLLRRISEIVGGKRGRVVRNMYKGHMDKAKEGLIKGGK